MKRSNRAKKVPIEQMLAEVAAYLVEIEEVRLPSLEARVGDIRAVCQKAYDALGRVEQRVLAQKPSK